jgi:hypothetical protein
MKLNVSSEIPVVTDLPKGHVILLLGELGLGFVMVHGPKEKCLPEEDGEFKEIFDAATIVVFDCDGLPQKSYQSFHGHIYPWIGGMIEFEEPELNIKVQISWTTTNAYYDHSEFKKIHIAV